MESDPLGDHGHARAAFRRVLASPARLSWLEEARTATLEQAVLVVGSLTAPGDLVTKRLSCLFRRWLQERLALKVSSRLA
jgi:hypothetical protein